MSLAKRTRKARLKRPPFMSVKEWKYLTPGDKKDLLHNRKEGYRDLALFYKENGYYETRYHRKNKRSTGP